MFRFRTLSRALVTPTRLISVCLCLSLFIFQLGAAESSSKNPRNRSFPPEDLQITDQEAQKLMQYLMGKTPIENTPETEDGVRVVIQQGHTGPIQSVAVSPNGRYAVSGGLDETAKVWDLAGNQEIHSFSGFGMMGPRQTVFSEDSQTVIVADMQTVKIFDLATGKVLQSHTPFFVERLALSQNGKWMAASGQHLKNNSSHRTLEVWNIADKKPLPPLPQAKDHSVVALNHNGQFLVTRRAETDGELVLWDLQSSKPIREFGKTPDLWLAAFSPDSTLLATQELEKGTLTVRETSNGKILFSAETPDPEHPNGSSLTFSPDNTLLAVSYLSHPGKNFSYPAKVLDARTGTVQLELRSSAIGFSPDNRHLIVARPSQGAPALVERESGEETPISRGSSGVMDLALTKDGKTLIAGMSDDSVKIWDLITGEIVKVLEGPSSGSVSVAPDGRLVATGGSRGLVRVYNRTTGQVLKTWNEEKAENQAAIVRFSNDGQFLAIGTGESVTLRDTQSWDIRWNSTVPMKSQAPGFFPGAFSGSPKGIQQIAFSPDDHLLAISTGSYAGVWDARTGQKRYAIGGGGMQSLMEMALSGRQPHPDESFLNPLALQMQLLGGRDIKTLAFHPQGTQLLSVGIMGKQLWNTKSGKPLSTGFPDLRKTRDPKQLIKGLEINASKGGAFRPDGRRVAYGHGRNIKFLDLESHQEIPPSSGHTSDLSAVIYSPDERFLISGSRDGTIRLWDAQTGKEKVSLIATGREDFVAVTPDQYYRLSKHGMGGVAFRSKGVLYPFDQFDLRFNRPDIILERLGYADPYLIRSYRRAYEKRLRKMGLTEEELGTDMHLPEITSLKYDIPATVTTPNVSLHVKARDSAYPLHHLNLYVNDVPIHGTQGLTYGTQPPLTDERTLTVPLVPGRNKIQVSVMNQQGAESLRKTLYTVYSPDQVQQDLYLVAIGVSQYKNRAYNLRFAAKDAEDVIQSYQATPQTWSHVHVRALTDEQATRTNIENAKQWLMQSRPHDLVVIFAAGHGMTDSEANYYFGTYNINAADPSKNGLPYEGFEDLLDGIPALQKVLLLDTCFSGEIDDDIPTPIEEIPLSDGKTEQVMVRSFKPIRGISLVADKASNVTTDGLTSDTIRFQQDWFADLRRGTGAAVISSSSGNEYSLEGPQWQNGVFTYALLQGITRYLADENADRQIMVSELQAYVIDQVRELTQGGQNPTVRRQNLSYDFAVY
ncbi:MAG: caspase family protein [Nitrospirales bacterium]